MEDLVDIADVKIHTELDTKERICNYVEQIKNPYLFKARGMMDKNQFQREQETGRLYQRLLFLKEHLRRE